MMDKRMLIDITDEDTLQKVWDKNRKIRDRTFHAMWNDVVEECREEIDTAFMNVVSFYIDAYGNPILEIRDEDSFLDGCHYLNEHYFYFIPENEKQGLLDADEICRRLKELDEDSDDYTDAETKRDEAFRTLNRYICDHIRCDIECTYDDYMAFDYWFENLDYILCGHDVWIDDDYVAYENQIICYK